MIYGYMHPALAYVNTLIWNPKDLRYEACLITAYRLTVFNHFIFTNQL
jgi:hypothetical protein